MTVIKFAPNKNITRYPNQDELIETFVYIDGLLYWLYEGSGRNKRDMKKPVGFECNKYGHKQVFINGQNFLVHRLIWIYHYGDIPDGNYVDHKDHNARNNRIENLRLATHKQNKQNNNIPSNNKTGVKGVSFNKWGSYSAFYRANGETVFIGSYKNIFEAYEARKKYAMKEYGDFYSNDLSPELEEKYQEWIKSRGESSNMFFDRKEAA